ncbi:MAG: fatty acid desaturase [Rhodobacteraceae bacterium]|nr:fatty acid desaturase [Paracoccaceae bacterium]
MPWYPVASLAPPALLALACVFGGAWSAAGLIAATIWVVALDRLRAPDESGGTAMRWLPTLLALAHPVLLALGVWALGGDGHLEGAAALATGAGLGVVFGQISNAAAHELIHRPNRFERRLGAAVYTSLLFGHHVSAHLHVHHVHVATDADPNSARLGEGFWHFLGRAWVGSFRAGLRAENRRRRQGRGKGLHPYARHAIGAALTVAAAAALAGPRGVAVLLLFAGYAQLQLLLSDYVQHYGLRRRARADGRAEPAGPTHAWNAPHWYSGAMLLNAARHSDHHSHPARPFADLRIDPQAMPLLPRSMPVMAMAALIPPLWHRLMDRRARRWRTATAHRNGAARADLAQSVS